MPIKKRTVAAKKPASAVRVAIPKPKPAPVKIETLEGKVWINWIEYSKDALFYKLNEVIDAINK